MTDIASSLEPYEDTEALKERVRELEIQNAKLKEAVAKDKRLKPYQIELLKLQ